MFLLLKKINQNKIMNINGQKAKAWTHELRLGQLATQWWDPWPKGPGDSECWGEWKTSKSKAVWGSKESPQRIKNSLVITGNKLHWIFTLKGSGKNSFILKTLSLGVMIICLKLPCGGCYFKYLCVFTYGIQMVFGTFKIQGYSVKQTNITIIPQLLICRTNS